MRRGAQIATISASAAAGALCAAVLVLSPAARAEEGTGTSPTAPTDTTSTTPTVPVTTTPVTTSPVTTSPVSRPRARLKEPKLIVPGVTIGGTPVGGLSAAEARELVVERFETPLKVVLARSRVVLRPGQLGARPELKKAIGLALRVRRAGYPVPLAVEVRRERVEALVSRLARDYRRDPVDAELSMRNLTPVVKGDIPGRRIQEVLAERAIVRALKTHDRAPLELPVVDVLPTVTAGELGRAIVIRRGSKELLLYRVGKVPKLIRAFQVATGLAQYPTPLGRFEIITKQENPWWYPPPTSGWAQGKEPVPPGPGNPLGTRWMGISSPYVGIHGTPDAASIGYSASHGCVRMLIPEAEWLFKQVEVGTPVFIVAA